MSERYENPHDLLRKHYGVMIEALNDIKDVINTDQRLLFGVPSVEVYADLLAQIEDIAAAASTIDLFNPHNRPGDPEECIGRMVWTPPA